VLGSHIYCIGGGYRSVVDRFDTASGTWTTLAALPTARQDAASFVLDGKIYVAGGENTDVDFMDPVAVYDPSTGSWATVSDLPINLCGASACAM
jgi:N-acetylneuraminic acid mutarotase